jgi:hypothetical protein
MVLTACSSFTQRGDELRIPVPMSEADSACVEFFQSVDDSVEEETVYLPVLARRIMEAGHQEAAAILADVAAQFEVGVWEVGEVEPELLISAQLGQAGSLLLAAGAFRCAALGEIWHIDGYEGEPTPKEMLGWQRRIWEANAVSNYKLLVAELPLGEGGRQYHVEVVGGEVREVWDAVTGDRVKPSEVDDLPLTVDEIYRWAEPGEPITYDLVHAVPQRVDTLFIRFDLEEFPEPLEQFEELILPLED